MSQRWVGATGISRVAGGVLLVTAMLLSACRHRDQQKGKPEPEVSVLVRDDVEGLLLTWVDERGDFHVEQKVSDVPLAARDVVRVVDPAKDQGTHEHAIVVADLRNRRPDGTYPTRIMTRAEFDAIALERRARHASTLAPVPSTMPSGVLPPPAGNLGPDPRSAVAKPVVIIYGAPWCTACHEAAAYLRRKGVSFVEKDVEADENANGEMRGKLTRAGLRGGSIPVIDVRGKVLVGFNPQTLDEALGPTL